MLDILNIQRAHIKQRLQIKQLTLNAQALQAAKDGDKQLIDQLIQQGADNFDWMAFAAAEGGHQQLVDEMIQRGAKDLNGIATEAAHAGHIQIIEQMLALGANDFNSIAAIAASGGHKDIVEQMIQRGATLAQLAEHPTCNRKVGGSIPLGGSNRGQVPEWLKGTVCKTVGASLRWFESIPAHQPAGIAQLVEHRLPKPRVAGSSPVSRSTKGPDSSGPLGSSSSAVEHTLGKGEVAGSIPASSSTLGRYPPWRKASLSAPSRTSTWAP
jgi:hypothetical protein